MTDTTVAGVDVTTLSDADLYALRDATSSESVRRQALASLPGQAALLAQNYVSAGGNLQDVVTAVQNSGKDETT